MNIRLKLIWCVILLFIVHCGSEIMSDAQNTRDGEVPEIKKEQKDQLITPWEVQGATNEDGSEEVGVVVVVCVVEEG